MKCNHSKIAALFFAVVSSTATGAELSDAELADICGEALRTANSRGGSERRAEGFANGLDGLTDAQKIRALAFWAFTIDEIPVRHMRWETTADLVYFQALKPDIIQDWREMRKLLKNEQDPRKFFLLCSMTGPTMEADGLIPEKFHMLFAEGRVVKDAGERTPPWAHSVAAYTYSHIVGMLSKRGAAFERPLDSVPLEERVFILANWLKEHWPGCAELEIPDEERMRHALPGQPHSERAPKAIPPAREKPGPDQQSGMQISERIALAGALLLLVVAITWFVLRRKSGRIGRDGT
jgi:hypothetical protein